MSLPERWRLHKEFAKRSGDYLYQSTQTTCQWRRISMKGRTIRASEVGTCPALTCAAPG